jgi:Tol biopolymer transport system component
VSGLVRGNRELVWVDRTGKRLRILTKPDNISHLALSPDGTTVAYVIGESNTGPADIWLQDLERGFASKFTSGPRVNRSPIWSPDGKRLLFMSNPTAVTYNFSEKPAGGADTETVVLPNPDGGNSVSPTDWSSDSKVVVYSARTAETKDDLWLLPMEGDHKPTPFLRTASNESQGQFSVDGKWLAYVSDESGRYEVYVQPNPKTGRRWPISTAGGLEPRWSRDGHELFYISGAQTLVAVPVSMGAGFQPGPAQTLFKGVQVPPVGGGGSYQPSRDGQGFLMLMWAEGDAPGPSPITVVLNWQEGLKARVPTK